MADGRKSEVLAVLSGVKFPGLSRDIVSFGFVHDLEITGGRVSFIIRLQTENPAVGEQIIRESESAVKGLGWVEEVVIRPDIQTRRMAGGTASMGGAPPETSLRSLDKIRFKIAVASGKGGVGKSTVSTNLALALQKLGHRVALLDSDIYGPSQQMMLGIEGRPEIDSSDEKIVPMERYGIKTMSLGFITDVDTPVIWRGPMVMKALDQFLTDVKWGELDFMVIDLPPGTGDAQLTITQKVPLDGAVIVTTPQDISLIDARKGLAMFRKVHVPVMGIIENMSYYNCRHCGQREEIFGHGGGQRTAEMLDVPFLGEIPIDPQVVVGGDRGQPIVEMDPESAAAKAFMRLAEQVIQQVGAHAHA